MITVPSTHLEVLKESLPGGFEFYHLGEVKQAPFSENEAEDTEELLKGSATVGFSLEGDVRGALLIAFERALDFSTYAEMGNIVASRIATTLKNRNGLDVMISPPKTISERQLNSLLPALRNSACLTRTYLHQLPGSGEKKGVAIPVHVVISPLTAPMTRLLEEDHGHV